MKNYKDIHNHLLFGVDDGPSTLEESIEMIHFLVSFGYTDVIVTPHYHKRRKYTKSKEEIYKSYDTLKNYVIKNDIKLNIHLGSEIYIYDDIADDLINNLRQSLMDSKYVLIEFATTLEYDFINECIYDIVHEGFIPIIAHPERYQYKPKKAIEVCSEWIKNGALLQLNFGSLRGYYGKNVHKTAKLLTKNKLYHFAASDVHLATNMGDVNDTFKAIASIVNKEYAEEILFNNQKCIFEKD